MWSVIVLFLVGVVLSAFFSGAETGFYRVTRLRLMLDSRQGDSVSRSLLWMTNNPTAFVATTLIGNNIANYLTSLAIVLGVGLISEPVIPSLDVLAPILLSPIVFVYGELIPKTVFHDAPNRLLRIVGPFFLFCAALFAPIAFILWLFARVLQSLAGETPLRVQLDMARNSLQSLFQESKLQGVLLPVQTGLAERLFAHEHMTIGQVAVPVSRVHALSEGASMDEIKRRARKLHRSSMPVLRKNRESFSGYLSVLSLKVHQDDMTQLMRPLVSIPEDMPILEAVIYLQTQHEPMAQVVDQSGVTKGLVYLNEVAGRLFNFRAIRTADPTG